MSARADIAEAYITIVYFLKDTTMGKEKCLNLVIVQNGNCGMERVQNKARSKATISLDDRFQEATKRNKCSINYRFRNNLVRLH